MGARAASGAAEGGEEMKRYPLLVAAVALAAGAAWGADCVVEQAPAAGSVCAAAATDDQLELSWDNGTRRWSLAWYTGADAWVGNDFNLSTISAYRAIEKVRYYTRDDWPNTQWDGFRVAIYNFSAVPGSRLWPTSGSGYFFKPSGLHGHIWVDVAIGWTCPSAAFFAAVEQFYNYPGCDPMAIDANPTFRGHSWQYYQGQWGPFEQFNIAPYRNIMVRVVVDNTTLHLTATSMGRVKALYY